MERQLPKDIIRGKDWGAATIVKRERLAFIKKNLPPYYGMREAFPPGISKSTFLET